MPHHSSRSLVLVAAVASVAIPLLAGAAAPASADSGSWYVSADALYASRSISGRSAPTVIPLAGPGSIFTGNTVHAGPEAGLDARLGWTNDTWGVEGRYLGAFRWTGSADGGAVGNVRIGSFSNFGATDLTDSVDSRLDTAEVDITRALTPAFTVFGGVRWMHFDDQNSMNITFPTFTAAYNFAADTTGWAPQLGVEGKFSMLNSTGGEIAYVNLDVRGGALFEKNTDSFNLLPSTGGSFPGGGGASKTSSFIEAGAVIGHRLGHYSLEAGYRIFYVDEIPDGTGYAAAALASFGQSMPPTYHNLVVQTVTLGVKAQF